MARPKKDGKYINFYMDAEIYAALEKYAEESGLTKTKTMEWALKQYIELSGGYTIKKGKLIPNVSFEEYLNN